MDEQTKIEQEIGTLLAGLPHVQSYSVGRIRYIVPIPQMPSVDIAHTGYAYRADNLASTSYSIVAYVRVNSYNKERNSAIVNEILYNICSRLKSARGSNYNVVRDLAYTISEAPGVESEWTLTATVNFNCLIE